MSDPSDLIQAANAAVFLTDRISPSVSIYDRKRKCYDDTMWEVTYLKIETVADGDQDSLYANGRMQIPVVVVLKAIDQGTTERYWLQPEDLKGIALIEYDDPSSTLSGGWSYTDERNNDNVFSTTIHAESLVRPVTVQSDNDVQLKKFWVSTTMTESKRVGASIQQPDGKTVTTHSEFVSHVTLKGLDPIVYTTDNVTVVREDTANGSYKFEWQNALTRKWATTQKNWDQDNYFVSSTIHRFIKADIHDYDTTGDAEGHPSDERLKNCYAYCAPDNKNLKLSFIWEFGPEVTKTAGLLRNQNITDWGKKCGRIAHAYPDIKVNQKINALCLTRLAIDCPDTIWGGRWANNNCGFTIYDIYGNSGKFSAGYSGDHNHIIISNTN